MKRVLVIANLYHASPRIPGLCTYLPEFGWEATVVTPELGKGAEAQLGFPRDFLKRTRVVEAPFRGDIFWFWRKVFQRLGLREGQSLTEQIKERGGLLGQTSLIDRMMRWYQTIFAYPDTERTWRKPSLNAGRRILGKEPFDAILSSSPFPTNHIVAAELKREFKIGWIADFRDPWTQNHNYPFGRLRRYFEEKLEVRTLRHADAMVTAAPAYAMKQEDLHRRPAVVITNGFADEDFHESPMSLREKFTITYTGTIYPGKQDPEKLLRALKQLTAEKQIEGEQVEVRFYGQPYYWLKKKIEEHGLSKSIKLLGTISRQESFQRQRESHLLLLLNWEDPKEKGVYPLKFFEYLSARRPILATGGFCGDDIERLLQETRAGIYAPTPEVIKEAISNAYREYRQTKTVTYSGNFEEIKKYSYHALASRFADILRQIANKSTGAILRTM